MKFLLILVIMSLSAPPALSQTKIMALGESTTAAAPGFKKKFFDLAKADGLSIDMIGPNSDGINLPYDSDNAGFRGKVCSDLIKWIDSVYVDYNPDIVILWEGTNDCGWGYKFYADKHPCIVELSLLINEICIKYPNARVFAASVPPLSNTAFGEYQVPAGMANANVTTFNNAMPGMISMKINEGKKVHFVDARSLLNVSADISPDGIHPNQKGYDKMGVLFYDAVHPFITSKKAGNDPGIVVYPNPVTNYQIVLRSSSSPSEIFNLSLYNVIGHKVYYADVRNSPSISVALPQYLIKGIYFLKIDDGINTVIRRIVIDTDSH